MSRDIKVGDWVIVFDYQYKAIGPVSATTSKTFTAPSPWSGHQGRMSPRSALFAGTKEESIRLAARLQSSLAMADDESRRAKERHEARAIDLLQKAETSRDGAQDASAKAGSGLNPKGGPA